MSDRHGDRTTHVGPIVFSNETARQQLVEHGEVVTFRKDKRTTGETWWRESRTGPKRGDVIVEEIGAVNPWRFDDPHAPGESDLKLEDYGEWSGFESVDEWRDAIYDLNGGACEGHLYRAVVPDRD